MTASAATLARRYEILRADAIGAPVSGTPRGLAVLRGAGMVAWMAACPPDRPVFARGRPATPVMEPVPGVRRELVGVLAAMALAPRTHPEEVIS